MFADADSDDKNVKKPVDISQFEMYRKKVRNREPLGYDDVEFHKVLDQYKAQIANKQFLIIGTISVWIEAIAYELAASKITTLDYTRKYWHDPK
jgi:hypothetical protein